MESLWRHYMVCIHIYDYMCVFNWQNTLLKTFLLLSSDGTILYNYTFMPSMEFFTVDFDSFQFLWYFCFLWCIDTLIHIIAWIVRQSFKVFFHDITWFLYFTGDRYWDERGTSMMKINICLYVWEYVLLQPFMKQISQTILILWVTEGIWSCKGRSRAFFQKQELE